jgi:ABC-2 type transport system ATP-binding protein
VTFGLRSATVRFGDVVALDHVTVEVPAGSVVAVVGGDGAGKTTLLRALVREVRLDAGEVDAPGKAQLGFLPASAGSWAALSVTQNLDFAAGVYGLTGAAVDARRDELLERADLSAAADRLASQLSGGMRRKLGFCMAIAHRPDLLVLDEPSTGVDPVSRIDLWRLVSEAAAGGAAVIMSTTYLDEAERAAHLVVLEAGRTLVQGTYDDVRAGFTGIVTRGTEPVRREWSWRRGLDRHEYWPDADPPAHLAVVQPDLEDVVIALSLARRAAAGVPS